MMIIDSHVHVWTEATDPRRGPAPWPQAAFSDEYRAYTLDQVDAEMTDSGVEGAVLVQAVPSLQHTDDLLAAAAAAGRPVKVVGWVPLTDPEQTALALRRYADRAELAGVRQWRHDNDVDFLLRPDVTASLDLVSGAGLSLDVLPWPVEVLKQVPEIARRHPGMPIALNLLGWPQVTGGRMQPWTDQLAAAAAQPTVHVKLGGPYLRSGWRPDPDTWRPYVATLVDLFGADRIMIGTNWPVMTMYGHTYTQTITALRDALDELIELEREQVMAGTAARVYRFDTLRTGGARQSGDGQPGPAVAPSPA